MLERDRARRRMVPEPKRTSTVGLIHKIHFSVNHNSTLPTLKKTGKLFLAVKHDTRYPAAGADGEVLILVEILS